MEASDLARQRKLDAVYRHTHSDYKGEINGVRTIMVYRNGTTLVALDDLTDQEINDRLPKGKKS
ncbi:hypothetical protein DL1_08585 [Thioclava dalianensis]|uniref:Uncharacterized protein n=1 Tax=Thioclava dalianensis TaxID=1185766 RepID=A0A074TIK2_9RHOB|nr:hypothetical protein [Thioclava dalianensis]KEP68823.1 hypothetical protein DL1_08585 [Thioclava dalianensis]SFN49651.1 hypothetical protein SAMN05216224_10670 [Thioclava dalianensis]